MLWPKLAIERDTFIRTTVTCTRVNIQRIWQQLSPRQGDRPSWTLFNHYCIECEQFYPEKDLLDGTSCPVVKREVIWSL